MPKIRYKSLRLRKDTLDVIAKANGIIAEYATQGFDLTLRQLFYQFVSRALIPNSDREYKKLGNTIADGRLAGLIDWNAIVDRTRFLRTQPTWRSPEAIVKACADQFELNKWENQSSYCEVFIEKDALIGVIEGVCEELQVSYLACRGYASASEIWRAGHDRLRKQWRDDKQIRIFYLGDHDPSGIDMTRDIQERLDLFIGEENAVTVERLALNYDQIEQYNPPSNPTKITDSRAQGYISEFGHTCWELDALDPAVIAELIRDAVKGIRDDELWDEAVVRENQAKADLASVANNWDSVVERLGEDGDK